MKAIRELFKYIKNNIPEENPLRELSEDAEIEFEAVETTFSEIAKLQERIFGKTGGTAHNKQSTPLSCNIPDCDNPVVVGYCQHHYDLLD